MSIIAKGETGTSDFTPCPAGMHQGVCVDVIDRGIEETPWGEKHRVVIKWQVSALMDDGRPYLVQKLYTLSLHEKSNLRHDLESWRGKPFADREVSEGFDLENLLGANCQLLVVHNTPRDRTYANVTAVTPLAAGMRKIEPRDYERVIDRMTQEPHTPHAAPPPPPDRYSPEQFDDSIPF